MKPRLNLMPLIIIITEMDLCVSVHVRVQEAGNNEVAARSLTFYRVAIAFITNQILSFATGITLHSSVSSSFAIIEAAAAAS